MKYKRDDGKRKSRLWKWIKRIAFVIFLFLIFLEFNHLTLAIEALQNVNTDQMNLINELSQKVHHLELSNANLQIQNEYLKVRINGMEVQNIHSVIHNVTPDTDLHTASHINMPSLPSVVITGALVGIMAALKGLSTFIPALP